MTKILFICHGNICRSPMAEFVMKDLVKKAGMEKEFQIDSAATSREEIGNPVYPPARQKLAEHGIACDGHAARQLTREDYNSYDLLIGMDRANLTNMRRICGNDNCAKMSILMDHAEPRPGTPTEEGSRDVADPWYTGDFESTWRDVLDGCQGLLRELTVVGSNAGNSGHFFYVDETSFRHLRPATGEERDWYNGLAGELANYSENIDRFERVEDCFDEFQKLLAMSGNVAEITRTAKGMVANFLYSFNECLDHWKTYISRTYGDDSAYFRRYKELTASAFDSCDEYKITYALRNFQHVDDVLGGISVVWGEPVRLFADRRKMMDKFDFTAAQRPAFEKQPDRFELLPIFSTAKLKLESIEKSLMFYTVTEDLERRVMDALEFKNQLCGTGGTLLLGKITDEHGCELEPSDETFLSLMKDEKKWSFNYQNEIPWGICRLIAQFRGTDYTSA